MKKHNIIYTAAALALSAMTLTSCSDFLDKMPDNRTVLDKPSKIAGLLTTAYPNTSYMVINELMSDNMDYMGKENSLGDREGDQMFFWQEDKENGNDSPESLWMVYNGCVAQANQALTSIEELGGATTNELRNSKGEALLLRAYNNFLLVNEFCQAYSASTADKNMGIYYSKQIEEITSNGDRGTVADVYANIAKDIEEGLPLINDNYTVPKYHFNRQAAYAFAARFYLYYEKWAEAEKYASLALGSNYVSSLRNYDELQAMPLSTSDQAVKIAEAYCNADEPSNFLITTATTAAGLTLGPWRYNKRYTHSQVLASTEDIWSNNVWGNRRNLRWRPFDSNQGESNYAVLMKIPYEFESIDETAGTGYYRALNVNFTLGEALLTRAEAYIMQKKYDQGAADMNVWMHNFFTTDSVLTPASIQNYFKDIAYAYDDAEKLNSTFKKHLHPGFAIDAEGSMQESMLQCVLDLRRIETMHQGLRWFDIKRYGIEIPRRLIGSDGRVSKNLDWLTKDDPRHAVQIPASIVEAGVPANPTK